MRPISLACSLALLTIVDWIRPASPAAQPLPPTLPAPTPDARARFPVVRIWGHAESDHERLADGRYRDRNRFLRRALPVEDIRTLVRPDDEPVARSDHGNARVRLSIDEQGGVNDCRVERASGILDAGTCERLVDRLRMVPALDQSGRRTPDVYFIWLNYASEPLQPAEWVIIQAPPPAPPPPRPPGAPPPPRELQWPPSFAGRDVRVEGLDLWPPDQVPPADAPWVGVRVRRDRDGIRCEVHAPSGDPALDRDACQAAEAASYVSAEAAAQGTLLSIRFIQVDGRLRAMLPIHRQTQAPTLTDAGRATLLDGVEASEGLDRLRLTVRTGPDGVATDCEVTATSGDDLLDYTLCRRLMERAHLLAARDIFGFETEGSLWNWTPAPTDR